MEYTPGKLHPGISSGHVHGGSPSYQYQGQKKDNKRTQAPQETLCVEARMYIVKLAPHQSTRKIGFWQYRVEYCMFYWCKGIVVVYSDDEIFDYPIDTSIYQAIIDIGAKFAVEY